IRREELSAADVPVARLEDVYEIGRQVVGDVDKERPLRGRRVLEERVRRERVPQLAQSAIRRALVPALHLYVQARLVRPVVDDQGRNVLQIHSREQGSEGRQTMALLENCE